MRSSTYDPLEEGIQSAMYEEAKRQEKAYYLLRQGLARYEASEQVLDASDLTAILPFREKLVLSGRERWLLDRSQEVHQVKRARRRAQMQRAVLFSVVLMVLFSQPWRWLSTGYEEEARPLQAVLDQPVPPARISQSEEPIPPEEQQNTPMLPPLESKAKETAKKSENREAASPEPERETPENAAAADPKSKFSVVIPVRTSTGEVWRVRKAGKWGLAGIHGDVLLPLKFRRVRVLHEEQGYFILEDGRRRGIADATGRILLPPVYDGLGTYYEASALLVVKKQGQSGVFNLRKRRMIIEPGFRDIRHFSEGLFGVQSANGKWGFADAEGEVVIPAAFDAIIEPFRSGRALVTTDSARYYIDRDGEVLASRR